MSVVYRFHDADGALLYVGRSNNYLSRLDSHVYTAPWVDQVASATFAHYDTTEESKVAEEQAIRTEQPRYNIQFSGRRNSPRRSEPVDGWASPNQAALVLQVSTKTVDRLTAAGKLRTQLTAGGHKRVNLDDVHAVLAERVKAAAS